MYHMMRVALKDDVIPLSEPIYTTDGRMIDQIPVAKGQTIVISTCAYHRYIHFQIWVFIATNAAVQRQELGRRRRQVQPMALPGWQRPARLQNWSTRECVSIFPNYPARSAI